MRIINRCIYRNRNYLIDCIKTEVKQNAKHFKGLKSIIVYDVDNGKNTCLRWYYPHIRINLAELFNLYKNPCEHSRGTPRINKFKDYLVYALYHELGHYKLREYYYNESSYTYTQSRKKFELKADKFSRLYLKKRGFIK